MDDMTEIKLELRKISDTLVRNTASLEIHVARTELAEKRLDHIEVFNRWFLGLFITSLVAAIIKFMFR